MNYDSSLVGVRTGDHLEDSIMFENDLALSKKKKSFTNRKWQNGLHRMKKWLDLQKRASLFFLFWSRSALCFD